MRTILLLLATLIAGSQVEGQRRKKKLPAWKIDPYTRNDPEAMTRAGYVSFGPFPWGDKHDTTLIEQTLGKVKLRFVETAHFKMGISLPPYPVPTDPKVKRKIRGELERLKEKLPRVNIKTRVLDEWLRLHLFAQRLEDIYKEFSDRLGVTDESFPAKKGTFLGGRYMGEGPYLGEPEKYTVLLFRKEGDHMRYLTNFVGTVQRFPKRHNFKVTGSLLFVTAEDLEGGRCRNDTAMHCQVVWNVVHNLIDGYRFYSHDLPVWWKEGMAHYFGRRVSPKWNNFDQNESSKADMRKLWKWKPAVRRLVVTNKFTPASVMLSWRDYGQIKFNDHLVCWSKVEYLMGLGDEQFQTFMNTVKGIVDPSGRVVGKRILEYQRNAMKKAWKLNALTFDLKWKEYVLKTYPTR